MMTHKLQTTTILLFSAISLLFFQTATIQSQQNNIVYAQAIKSFSVIAELDQKIIKRGDTQTIHVTVEETDSDQPISGAYVEARVTYPGGVVTKAINSVTDKAGHTTINIPTGSGTEFDTTFVDLFVSLTGFNPANIQLLYAVVSENIDNDNNN